jgi:hypothetical protein
MATERRKRKQRGQEIIEFGITAILLVPMFLGTFVTGMNLIRSIQVNQVCRDLTDMYIHGADFSTYSMQQEAQRLAQGLGLTIGSSFSGNEQANTSNSGNGIVTVTEIMYVGPTTASNCTAVGASNCTNHDSFVYLQQIQFGNGTLSNASTVTLGVPSGVTYSSDGTGMVTNPVTDSHAKLATTPQAAMVALWQTTNNGQQALTDGEVAYIVECYFQSPDLTVSSLTGGGVYARYFF